MHAESISTKLIYLRTWGFSNSNSFCFSPFAFQDFFVQQTTFRIRGKREMFLVCYVKIIQDSIFVSRKTYSDLKKALCFLKIGWIVIDAGRLQMNIFSNKHISFKQKFPVALTDYRVVHFCPSHSFPLPFLLHHVFWSLWSSPRKDGNYYCRSHTLQIGDRLQIW